MYFYGWTKNYEKQSDRYKMRTEMFETVLLKVFLILTSELCMPPVNSGQSHHDLSRSAPPDISPGPFLPPAQLDLELSHHHPGQTLLSRGCPDTELLIRCPPDQMLLVHSARFIPAMWAGAADSGWGTALLLTDQAQPNTWGRSDKTFLWRKRHTASIEQKVFWILKWWRVQV